jgi:hypothetical protein
MITAILTSVLAFAQQQAKHIEMEPEGWVFMAAAWIFILSLTFYTFGKILKKK